MFWIFVRAVFFKLGVYSSVFGLLQLLAKALFVVSGAFLMVAGRVGPAGFGVRVCG